MNRDDFREQCRRQLDRPLAERLKHGFFRVYKPVLDDAPFRTFKTMKEYREWADQKLPRYLGFRVVNREDDE